MIFPMFLWDSKDYEMVCMEHAAHTINFLLPLI